MALNLKFVKIEIITKGFSAISVFHTGKTAKITVQTPKEIKKIIKREKIK